MIKWIIGLCVSIGIICGYPLDAKLSDILPGIMDEATRYYDYKGYKDFLDDISTKLEKEYNIDLKKSYDLCNPKDSKTIHYCNYILYKNLSYYDYKKYNFSEEDITNNLLYRVSLAKEMFTHTNNYNYKLTEFDAFLDFIASLDKRISLDELLKSEIEVSLLPNFLSNYRYFINKFFNIYDRIENYSINDYDREYRRFLCLEANKCYLAPYPNYVEVDSMTYYLVLERFYKSCVIDRVDHKAYTCKAVIDMLDSVSRIDHVLHSAHFYKYIVSYSNLLLATEDRDKLNNRYLKERYFQLRKYLKDYYDMN